MIHRIATANFKYSKPCSVSFTIKKNYCGHLKKNLFFFLCHEKNAGVSSLLPRNQVTGSYGNIQQDNTSLQFKGKPTLLPFLSQYHTAVKYAGDEKGRPLYSILSFKME